MRSIAIKDMSSKAGRMWEDTKDKTGNMADKVMAKYYDIKDDMDKKAQKSSRSK